MRSKSTLITYCLIGGFAAIGVVLVFLFLFDSPANVPKIANSQNPAQQHSSTAFNSSAFTTTPETKKKMEKDSGLEDDEELENEEKLETESDEIDPIVLWTLASSDHLDSTVPTHPAIHDPYVITLDSSWSTQFQEFDEVTLHLPNEDAIVIIENRSVSPNGDISWSGHLSGYEDQYPTVMTIGKTISFGTITTPSGEYTIEVKGTTGTVYKTPRVDELSSDDSPDFLIPDEHYINP